MARIPTYGQPQVGPVQVTNARLRPADNNGGLLGAIGEGMAGLGRATSQYANAQDEIEDRLARTNMQSLGLEFDKTAAGIRQNFTSLQGKDALDQRTATEEALSKVRDNILAKADPRTKAYLQPRLEEQFTRYTSDIGQYSIGQMKVYEQNVGKAAEVNFAESAVSSWDRPQEAESYIGQGIAQVETNLRRQGMGDPEIIKAEKAKYVSGIRSSVVDNFLTVGDVDGAEAYLEAYADQITAGDEVRIRSALKGPLEQRQAASDFVLATGGAEVGAGADTPLVGMFAAIRSNESGGKQFAKDGKPLTSAAGAVGIMQVMPGTAPEAANLAGVKWDENRYRNDAAYNQKIGEAYFKEMLRQFKDPDIAAAAYNAGPGAVRNAIAKGGENWLGELSAETRNYVGKFRKQIGAGSEARRWDKESVYTNIERAGQEQGWSFERIERAKDYADRQISRDEQLLARREQEADRQASELILGKADSFTDPSQIPRAVWGNMSVAAREAATNAAKANASGVSIKPNGEAAIGLNVIAAADPERFRDMDLTPFVGKVSRSELDGFLTQQAKLRSGQGQKIVNLRSNISSTIGFFAQGDKSLAKELDRKSNPEAYMRVFEDMNRTIESITDGKREATDAELKAAFDKATMKVIVRDRGLFGGDEADYRFNVEPGEATAVKVPVDVRSRIISSYRRANGGANPPDGLVGSIYLQHKGKAGFW